MRYVQFREQECSEAFCTHIPARDLRACLHEQWPSDTSVLNAEELFSPQEFSDDLKVVKVEADPNPTLVEKYKVSLQPKTHRSENCA